MSAGLEEFAARRAGPGSVDDFVYRVSHDLKSSARALRHLPAWLAENLEKDDDASRDEAIQNLNMIREHAERLDGMLSGMLTYSRVGRLQQNVVVRPSEVFETLLDEMPELATAQIVSNFQRFAVAMGERDLHQIFAILVSNAVVHNSTPEPRVEVTSCRNDRDWELLVSDNGPGIPAADCNRIFEPMVKLKGSSTVGMGLATLMKIVRRYEGSVHVEARRRRGGTTFRVRLPVAK